MEHEVSERPGAGGLPTLRFEAVYRVDGPRRRDQPCVSRYELRRPDRLERGRRSRQLTGHVSSLPTSRRRVRARELHAYPRELLRSPLDVTSAGARVVLGSGPGTPPTITGASAPERSTGSFESLVERENLGVGVILLSLLVAAFWGAAHALSPGHGKAMVAAYLVGSRGTPRHALLLGLTVTVTHTAGVFALGLVTLGLSELIVPEQLYPWLNLVSALLVVGVGASVLRARVRRRHAHHHHHHHAGDRSLRDLLAVGISGGLLPCPTALVVLLAAISLHRVGYGLVLILAFSLGLAGAMTAVGLAAVRARRFLRKKSFDGRLVSVLACRERRADPRARSRHDDPALPGVL